MSQSQTPSEWKKSFVLAALAGALVLSTGGVIYGRLTQRWGAPPRMKEAGIQLLTFPKQFGDWEVQAEVPVEDNVKEMLACDTFVNRRYVNRKSGDAVTLSVFVGPAGPTAVHTPEVCLSSRDYVLQAKRKKESIDSAGDVPDEFWSVTFDSRRVGGAPLRVFYAWLAEDHWEAPEYPRFEYGAKPLLYKIQVAGDVDSTAASPEEDSCHKFLTDFISTGWKPRQE